MAKCQSNQAETSLYDLFHRSHEGPGSVVALGVAAFLLSAGQLYIWSQPLIVHGRWPIFDLETPENSNSDDSTSLRKRADHHLPSGLQQVMAHVPESQPVTSHDTVHRINQPLTSVTHRIDALRV